MVGGDFSSTRGAGAGSVASFVELVSGCGLGSTDFEAGRGEGESAISGWGTNDTGGGAVAGGLAVAGMGAALVLCGVS